MIESFLKGSSVKVWVLVIFALFVCKKGLFAQNTVGIGTSNPNTNSVLELVSPGGNQGVLLPRITTLQRQAMAGSLSATENGLIVFDTDLRLFYHWVDNTWVSGLGSFSNVAGGDLQGTFPNPTLIDDAVNSAKIQDGAISTADVSDDAITSQKIDGEGNNNSVLATDAAGNPQWEPKSNFLGNGLADGTILIGDNANQAQPRTVTGDVTLANDGTSTINDNTITSAKIVDNTIGAADIGTDAVGSDEISSGAVTTDEILDNTVANVDLADDAVTSSKIADATISAADIGTDAVGSDEIASGAVGSDEILDGAVSNADLATNSVNSSTIADGSIITDDIASGGNNKVLITTAAGTVFWENISLFETSTLPEGNVFVGDVTNTAAPLNARGSGRILIGDGVSVQSLNVSGDISLASNGDAQINSGVVGSAEVTDNSLTIDDIAPNAVEASELADNAVDNGAIQDNAISTSKIQDGAINSAKIADGTIQTIDVADDAISTAKIDGEGNNDAVLTTNSSGNPQWESRSNFGTSSLPNANIFVGDGAGISQAQPVTGDVTLSNTGNIQINADVVGTNEVVDNSLTRDDIAPNAVEASELADNSVDAGAIQSDAVTTVKIADDAVSTAKIDGGGNNDAVLTTDAAGNPQWENKSTLDTDDTNELNTGANLTGTTLNIIDAGGTIPVDLSSLVDDADADPTNEIQDLDAVLTQGNDAGGNAITNTADPTNAQDVATKNYVDALEAADNDGDPTNELNTGANLTGTTLNIIDAGGTIPVDLSALVDDADADPTNEIQDLDAVLIQGNDAGGNAITNAADPTNAQDVATKNYVDALEAADNDGDPTNEIQDLSLAGNTLSLTSDPTTVDLSGYLDNTDNQDLNLAGNILSLTNDATPVDLSGYLDNTDNQDLANVLGQGNSAGGSAITNVADPSNAQDAATRNYVDTRSVDDADADPTNELQDLDAVLTQGNDAGGSAITNAADPVNPQDVATMNYVDNITVTGANIANNSISSNNIVNFSITAADIGNGEISTPKLEDGAVNSAKIEDLSIVNIDISNSANISASKLQSTVMVEGENVSLLANDAGYLTTVSSANITDGSIVDADVSNTANIGATKLQSTVMVEGENVSLLTNDAGYLSSVASADITDGTIVNADINNAAAIDGTKINPDFGTQNIQTTGTLNTGAATFSSLTVSDLAGANDTYTGDGAVNSFTISAAGAFSSSDRRLKKNIKELEGSLSNLQQIEGKSYNFKNDESKDLHFGLIAQDLQKLFPHLVKENDQGYLSVNYTELIPVLIEAIKEQQAIIEKLSSSLQQEKELGADLKASLFKQAQLLKAQQAIVQQLQLEKIRIKQDIEEIRKSLGIEAAKE